MRIRRAWLVAAISALAGACQQAAPSPATRAAPSGSVTTTPAGTTASTPDTTTSLTPVDAGLLDPVMAPPCVACNVVDAGVIRQTDDDGFSVAEGDCDDFNANVNPGAFDVPNNGIDEDCSGSDATSDSCDDGIAIDSTDPFAAARAIELCPQVDESSRRWGVISARWTSPDGTGKPSSDLLHGIVPNFGPSFMPRGGKTLLALSSGVARAPGQAGYTADCSDSFADKDGKFPMNFDPSSPSCMFDDPATGTGDAVALEVRVRMPSNATAISFDSAFFTEEYPDYICTPFNDFFQVLVDPARAGAAKDGNVVFDLDGNPVSVNNSLLRACAPGDHGGKTFACPLGTDSLKGTGYDQCDQDSAFPGGGLFGGSKDKAQIGASTSWLNTELAVMPGEIITMRFTIWDSEDTLLDSLALIDHAQFRLKTEPPPPEKPMTKPIMPD